MIVKWGEGYDWKCFLGDDHLGRRQELKGPLLGWAEVTFMSLNAVCVKQRTN